MLYLYPAVLLSILAVWHNIHGSLHKHFITTDMNVCLVMLIVLRANWNSKLDILEYSSDHKLITQMYKHFMTVKDTCVPIDIRVYRGSFQWEQVVVLIIMSNWCNNWDKLFLT